MSDLVIDKLIDIEGRLSVLETSITELKTSMSDTVLRLTAKNIVVIITAIIAAVTGVSISM